MRTSEKTDLIAAALVRAHAHLQNPVHDSDGQSGRGVYRYASLAAVREAVKPPLLAEGIAVLQCLRGSADGVECETMLLHSSGQFIAETLWLPAPKKDPQGFGSACSYARRYGLMAITGVVGNKDDDGQAACQPEVRRPKVETAKKPANPIARCKAAIQAAVSQQQLKRYRNAAIEKGWAQDPQLWEQLEALIDARWKVVPATDAEATAMATGQRTTQAG